MHDQVFTFQVEVDGDVLSHTSLPIFVDATNLIGGFIVDKGQVVSGFVSGTRYPAAIAISTGDKFYFTTFDDDSGKVDSAILTDYKLNATSILVSKAM